MPPIETHMYDDLNIAVSFGQYDIRVVHIAYLPFAPGESIGLHDHHCYELHYILSGEGIVSIGDQIHPLGQNSCYITGPHIPHAQQADVANPMVEYGLNFEILPKHKKGASQGDLYEQEKTQLVKQFLQNPIWIGEGAPQMGLLFDLMRAEFDRQIIGYCSNIKLLLSSLLIFMMRQSLPRQEAQYQIPKKNLNTKRQTLIHEYLHNHYRTADKDELADTLGISARQLSREISEMYPGSSFQREVLSIRLGHAKKLLAETMDTVESIVFETGFSSITYFCHAFKQEFHMTPSDYRKKMQQKNTGHET